MSIKKLNDFQKFQKTNNQGKGSVVINIIKNINTAMTRSCLKIILENAKIVFLSFEYHNKFRCGLPECTWYVGARRFQAWTKVAKQLCLSAGLV